MVSFSGWSSGWEMCCLDASGAFGFGEVGTGPLHLFGQAFVVLEQL